MSVEVEGLERVIRKLDGLDRPEVFRRPMGLATEHVRDKIATYPAPSGGRPQPFKTDKQRRYFFWALANGKIEVPYKRGISPRSEDLGPSWTIEISPDGRRGVVGNKASYARVVQDEEYEKYSHYHKETGWPTVQQVAKQEQRAVVGYFEKQYRRYARE